MSTNAVPADPNGLVPTTTERGMVAGPSRRPAALGAPLGDRSLARRPSFENLQNRPSPPPVPRPQQPRTVVSTRPVDRVQRITVKKPSFSDKASQNLENAIKNPIFVKSLFGLAGAGFAYLTCGGLVESVVDAIKSMSDTALGTVANVTEAGEAAAAAASEAAAVAAGGVVDTLYGGVQLAIGAGLVYGAAKALGGMTDGIDGIEGKGLDARAIKAFVGTSIGALAAAGITAGTLQAIGSEGIQAITTGETTAAVVAALALGMATGMASGTKSAAAVAATAILGTALATAAMSGQEAVAGIAGTTVMGVAGAAATALAGIALLASLVGAYDCRKEIAMILKYTAVGTTILAGLGATLIGIVKAGEYAKEPAIKTWDAITPLLGAAARPIASAAGSAAGGVSSFAGRIFELVRSPLASAAEGVASIAGRCLEIGGTAATMIKDAAKSAIVTYKIDKTFEAAMISLENFVKAYSPRAAEAGGEVLRVGSIMGISAIVAGLGYAAMEITNDTKPSGNGGKIAKAVIGAGTGAVIAGALNAIFSGAASGAVSGFNLTDVGIASQLGADPVAIAIGLGALAGLVSGKTRAAAAVTGGSVLALSVQTALAGNTSTAAVVNAAGMGEAAAVMGSVVVGGTLLALPFLSLATGVANFGMEVFGKIHEATKGIKIPALPKSKPAPKPKPEPEPEVEVEEVDTVDDNDSPVDEDAEQEPVSSDRPHRRENSSSASSSALALPIGRSRRPNSSSPQPLLK